MKKKMYRKLSCIVLSAVISISLLSGCSSQKEEGAVSNESTSQTAAGSETASEAETSEEAFVHDSNLNEPGEVGEGLPTICKETVSITIGLPQSPNVEDYDTNKQTLWLEKVGNYDIAFKLYPSEEFSTQINLAAAAGGGDLPDILLVNGQSDSVVNSWGAAGIIIPLNDYYENSAYYLPEAIERTGVDYYSQITAPDGNMYYVPVYNQSLTNEYGAKMWMYKPWLDKLDSEEISARVGYQIAFLPKDTQEELLDYKVNESKVVWLRSVYEGKDKKTTWHEGIVAENFERLPDPDAVENTTPVVLTEEEKEERKQNRKLNSKFKKALPGITLAVKEQLRPEDYEHADVIISEALKLYYQQKQN